MACALWIKSESERSERSTVYMCCCKKMKLNILGLVLFSVCVTALADDEDEGPVTPPSKCEGKILRLLWKSVVNMAAFQALSSWC